MRGFCQLSAIVQAPEPHAFWWSSTGISIKEGRDDEGLDGPSAEKMLSELVKLEHRYCSLFYPIASIDGSRITD